MKKEEIIARYGEETYQKRLEQNRQRRLDAPEKARAHDKNWRLRNPKKVKNQQEEQCRKGGKYYLRTLRYNSAGIQGNRNKIRVKHRRVWREYKRIIAPDSQIHHAWKVGSAEYDGVALVERAAHQHGIIDVIQILNGSITLFTERELRAQNMEL